MSSMNLLLKVRWVGVVCMLPTLCFCASDSHVFERLSREHRVTVVAHRGASAYAPENTLAAFKKAIELGIPSAECDLYLSSDRHIVVIHDETLERTTDGEGNVSEHTLAQLKKLDAGSWYAQDYQSERIPELGELLSLINDKLVLFLEIKGGSGIEAEINHLILDHDLEESVAIFSFDAERIETFNTINPDIATLLLVERPKDGSAYQQRVVDQALEVQADALGLDFPYINSSVIEAAHEAGLYVYAWTVNDLDQAKTLLLMGIDGIISDVPDQIKMAFDR